MKSFTAEQLAYLLVKDDRAKIIVEIGTATPIRYCSGVDAVQVDSDWYEPKAMEFEGFPLGEPAQATTSIHLDDVDGNIRYAWYTERWSDLDVTVGLLVKQHTERSWTRIMDVVWKCRSCRCTGKGNFIVDLYGASGLRKRAGLSVGTRVDFPNAPEAGEAIKIGNSFVVFSGGNNHTDPPDPPTRRITRPPFDVPAPLQVE